MKKLLLYLFVFLLPIVGLAQNYNPFVAQGIISPAPLFAVQNNGTGVVSFVVGNSGSDALPLVIGQEMRLIVSLSNGEPNHVDPLAALGGSFASYFNWVYDNTIKTYQGTQNQSIPGGLNGAGTITIAYKVTVNSSKASPQNGFNVNITPPAYSVGTNSLGDDQVSSYTWTSFIVSGNVYNDLNGSTNSLVDGFGANAGGLFYVSLVNNSNVVVATTSVAADGTYSFPQVDDASYTLVLHTNAGGSNTASIPANWVNTGEGLAAAGDGTPDGVITINVSGANVSNANFGVEQYPFTNTNTAAPQVNPGGTNAVNISASTFSGSDPDAGTVTQIRLLSFPSNATTIIVNGVSYTAGTFPGAGIYIPTNGSGNPTQSIAVDPVDGAVDVEFSYVTVDEANKEDQTPATATQPFSGETADLTISKSDGAGSYTPGTNTVYTIVVTNIGPSDVTGATIVDAMPAGVTWSYSAIATGGATGFNVSGTTDINDVINMPSGSSITYTVNVNIPSDFTGNLVNTATVAAPAGVTDNIPGNNSSTDTDLQNSVADLTISKTDGTTVYIPGTTTIYTIVVNNVGPSDVIGATISDNIPAGVTWTYTATQNGGALGFTASGASDINDVVDMPSGSSITYTVVVTIPAGFTGDLVNTASIAAPIDVTDNALANNTSTDIDTQSSVTDLSITKSVNNASPTVNSTVTFTILVNNLGPSDATGVSVIDQLPSGYTYQSHLASVGSYNEVTGIWTIGLLSNGSPATLTIAAMVNASGNYTNTATVSSTTSDPNAANNTGEATTTPSALSDVEVTKVVDDQFQSVGGTVTFTITAINNGPSTATNVSVADQLPSGFSYISNMPAQGSYDNTTGVWTVGTLANGSSATLTIAAAVLATGNYINTATIAADQSDPDNNNNTASTTNYVIQANDDAGSVNGVAGGTAIANVLANDLLNGATASTATVTISEVTPASHAGIVLNNTTGEVTVAPNTPAGTYTIVYQICELANSGNCDQATVTIIITSNISGVVFDDGDGLTNGVIDGTGTNAGGTLYMSLVDVGNTVVSTTAVNADGSYIFTGVNSGTYTAVLHTNPAGTNTASLPSGYVNTAEGTATGGDGSADGTTVLVFAAGTSNANFGIEQLPVAAVSTATTQVNPGGTNTVVVAATDFGGSDADGFIANLTITSFPTNITSIIINGTSYTSGTFPGTGVSIPTNAAGEPTQSIVIDPVNGFVDVVISYTVTDNAGFESANTGELTIPFIELPDLTPNITASPNIMNGVTAFDITVRVSEINNVNTSGTITVIIPKDSRVSFTYDPLLTSIGGTITTPLNNGNWSYDGSNSFYHIFTSNTVINAGSFSTFGFRASFNPMNAKGVYTLTSTINSGSGGENRTYNNNDSEMLDYFPN